MLPNNVMLSSDLYGLFYFILFKLFCLFYKLNRQVLKSVVFYLDLKVEETFFKIVESPNSVKRERVGKRERKRERERERKKIERGK